jgi:hypothetical protein
LPPARVELTPSLTLTPLAKARRLLRLWQRLRINRPWHLHATSSNGSLQCEGKIAGVKDGSGTQLWTFKWKTLDRTPNAGRKWNVSVAVHRLQKCQGTRAGYGCITLRTLSLVPSFALLQ